MQDLLERLFSIVERHNEVGKMITDPDVISDMKKYLSDIKKKATPTLRKYNVQRAFVFGSFSRGDFTVKSDIDFLMDFSAGTSLFDVIGLKHELEDLFGRNVDIVSRPAVSKYLLHHIKKDLQQVL